MFESSCTLRAGATNRRDHADDGVRRIQELVADFLATISGPATVESVRFRSDRATVYNFSVAGTSNYYIGHDGVLVHNCGGLRNGKLAGKTHPVTGIPFDANGYADFSSVSIFSLVVPGGHRGRGADFAYADKQVIKPQGYTWHHHQDGMTLQLVPTGIHSKTGYTGPIPGP